MGLGRRGGEVGLGRGGVGGGEGWEVGGILNPPLGPLGLFGLAMSPKSDSHRPKHA